MMTVSHPWHGVPGRREPTEDRERDHRDPQGPGAHRHEIDKDSGLLKLDRVIYSSFYYPVNYGFITQTYGDDKVPWTSWSSLPCPCRPMCLMGTKVMGVMQMVDSGDATIKIIAVRVKDSQCQSL